MRKWLAFLFLMVALPPVCAAGMCMGVSVSQTCAFVWMHRPWKKGLF